MKIILIRPPITLYYSDKLYVRTPLGLCYIASYLEQLGHSVKILDCVASSWKHPMKIKKHDEDLIHIGPKDKALTNEIEGFQPDVVGISCIASMYDESVHHLAGLAKEVNKDIVLLAGGPHPSAMPKEVLSDLNIDFVVIGEGEVTTGELLRRLEIGAPISDLDGLAFRKEKDIIVNPRTTFIENLDSLPFPARHLLSMEEYFEVNQLASNFGGRRKFPSTNMVTSRGCPRNCIFCTVPKIWGYHWRARSAENVLEEIKLLKNTYGVKEIQFEDDNMTANKSRIEDICRKIIKNKLKINWCCPNGVSINTLTPELIEIMGKAGCTGLAFGIEHGDPGMRANIVGKPIDTKRIESIVKACKDSGIWAHGFFVMGLPGENRQTFKKTIEFIKKLEFDSVSLFNALPLPGSELYKIAIKKGVISDPKRFLFDLRNSIPPRYSLTEFLSSKELYELQLEGYKEIMLEKIRKHLNLKSMPKKSWATVLMYRDLLQKRMRTN